MPPTIGLAESQQLKRPECFYASCSWSGAGASRSHHLTLKEAWSQVSVFRVGISWKFPSLFESETSERIESENARTSSPHPYHCGKTFTNKHKQEDTEYKRWPPQTLSLGDDLINNVCCGDRSDKSQTHH